ncbi:hypothetical protein FHG87_001420 [Trinorchestia longiramus]|nr:hypothetical protein FHG87_001420 [Trinorchestia longiramus]
MVRLESSYFTFIGSSETSPCSSTPPAGYSWNKSQLVVAGRNKLVFDCWKCMVDKKVKMADVNTKMEEEIKRLKVE